MKVGVPRESYPGERRVAMVPAVIPALLKAGLEVVVEAGAGAEAGFPDAEYCAKGATDPRGRAPGLRHRRHHRPGALPRLERQDRRGRSPPAAPRSGLDRFPAAAGIDRDHSRNRRAGESRRSPSS